MSFLACSIEGCSSEAHGRGFCRSHYMKWWRHGDPMHDEPKRVRAGRRYDWPKNTNVTALDTPCREWMGARTPKGYGSIGRDGKTVRVHRYVWEMTNGPIPNGMLVLHRCDNPACFRLDHLQLGSAHDNSMDMARKGRAPKAAAKLTPALVAEMRQRHARGESVAALSAAFGVAVATVRDATNGRTWTDVDLQERAA